MGRPSIIEPQPTPLPDEELVAKLFRTLGDPTRLRIVQLLLEGSRYQKDLVAAVGLSQAQVSQHLACLTWCGFVRAQRSGRLVQYSINDSQISAIIDLAHALLEDNEAEIAACRIAQ